MSTAAPFAPPVPQGKKSRTGLFVLLGCLGCGGLIAGIIVLAVGGTYLALQRASALFSPPVEDYLLAVNAENWERAFAMLDPEWQQAQPLDEWIAFEQSVRAQLGAFESLSMRSFNAQSSTAEGSYARASYAGQFEHSEASITVTLKQTGGVWRLQSIYYDGYAGQAGDGLTLDGAQPSPEPNDAAAVTPTDVPMSRPEESPFASLVTEYLTAINEDNWDRAYELLAPTWHEAQPKDEWIAFEQDIRATAGAFVELTGAANADVDGDVYSTDFAAAFENGAATLRVRTTRNEDFAWRLLEVTYQAFEGR